MPLSAMQIMYADMHGSTGEFDQEHVCRICGGPLLLPKKPASKLSNSWTDENLYNSTRGIIEEYNAFIPCCIMCLACAREVL